MDRHGLFIDFVPICLAMLFAREKVNASLLSYIHSLKKSKNVTKKKNKKIYYPSACSTEGYYERSIYRWWEPRTF
jgi:hypothetical protein